MTNIFDKIAYSYSKSKILDNCERCFFYCYYGSNGGWRKDAPLRTKLIYRLKQLQGLQPMLGEAIHEGITNLIVNPSLTLSR